MSLLAVGWVLLCNGSPLLAQWEWIGGDGAFHDEQMWGPTNGTPPAGATVDFFNGGTVTLGTTPSLHEVTVHNGNFQFVDGVITSNYGYVLGGDLTLAAGSTWDVLGVHYPDGSNGGVALYVNGNVRIEQDATINTYAVLSDSADFTIDGGRLISSAGGYWGMGFWGTESASSNLTVTNGGTYEETGSSGPNFYRGTVAVTGQGSTLTAPSWYVGFLDYSLGGGTPPPGTAVMNISDGATASTGDTYLGAGADWSATVNVDNASWSATYLGLSHVAYSGIGSAHVELSNGATLTADSISFNYASTANIGSSSQVDSDYIYFYGNDSTLTVTESSQVNIGEVYLSGATVSESASGLSGVIEAEWQSTTGGADSRVQTSRLYLADNSTYEVTETPSSTPFIAENGSIMVAGGSTFHVTGGAFLDYSYANIGVEYGFGGGRVLVDGDWTQAFFTQLEVGDEAFLEVGEGATVSAWGVGVSNGGTIKLSGGVLDASSGVTIYEDGRLEGAGTVVGPVYNLGEFSRGFTPDSITVEGDFVQVAAATLKMKLSSTGVDTLAVNDAVLAGQLVLSISAGDAPPTTAFPVIEYESRTGRFDTVTIAGEGAGNHLFNLHYGEDHVMAISGDWDSPADIAGEFYVQENLLLSGDWHWSGLLVKAGPGDLELDLSGGFTTGPDAALAIIDGTFRLKESSSGAALALSGLTFGDLGSLTGDHSLAGIWGLYYGGVQAVPEPAAGLLMATGAIVMLRRSRSACRTRGQGVGSL